MAGVYRPVVTVTWWHAEDMTIIGKLKSFLVLSGAESLIVLTAALLWGCRGSGQVQAPTRLACNNL